MSAERHDPTRQSNLIIDISGTRARLNGMFLRTVPIFQELEDKHIEALEEQFGSELHEPGVTIIEQGANGEKFYVIVRGRVEVLLRPDASAEHSVAGVPILEEGDFFGEIALITNAPRNATVRALDRCLLLTLTRAQFQGELDETPNLRARFETVVRNRLTIVA